MTFFTRTGLFVRMINRSLGSRSLVVALAPVHPFRSIAETVVSILMG